jgi:hypothetical protein
VIVDGSGRTFTHDVNTNTNYNPDAEARAGVFGMRSIAQYLGGLLRQGLAARAHLTGPCHLRQAVIPRTARLYPGAGGAPGCD